MSASTPWTLAVVQMDVAFANPAVNTERVLERFHTAVDHGATLVLFPECCLTGYCFESEAEALQAALPLGSPWLGKLHEAAAQRNRWLVVGFAEREGQRLYNTSLLLGPHTQLRYRKTHLPSLGLDKLACHGDGPYEVLDVEGVRLAMNICYDVSFPEPARILALRGADLILLPTNWPPGAELLPVHVVPTRSLENNIYYAAANRVGTERGFRFIGHSIITAPDGTVLAEAGAEEQVILYAEIDPAKARQKRLVRVPGKHEINRLADRRPDLYGELLRPYESAADNS